LIDIVLDMDGREEFYSFGVSSKEERLEQLIALCLKGERMAQFELYKFSFDYLYRIAIRYEKNHNDAIEIINEAFYNVLTKIGSFRNGLSFYPWIKTILINCIINKFRKSERIKNGGSHTIVSFEDEFVNASVEPDIIKKIDSEYVLEILSCLPELTRKIFNLFVIEEYSHRDIAKLLDIRENASRWHVYEGKKKLLKKLKDMGYGNDQ
jgi:RNA polymerase sigma factor (sigma-70 family)